MSKIRISISAVMRFSILFVVLMIFIVTFVYYSGIYQYSMQQLNNSHIKLTDMINRQLDILLTSSDDAVKRVLYAAGVQSLMFTNNPIEFLQNRPSALSFLDNAINTNALIKDIYIYCEDGYEFYASAEWQTRKRYADIIYNEVIAPNNIKPHFITSSYIKKGNIDSTVTELFYYIPMYNARLAHIPEYRLAHCIVACDVDALINMLSTGFYDHETIALMYGAEIITNNNEMADEFKDVINNINFSDVFSGTISFDNENYMYNRLLLTSLGKWSVVYLVPVESVLGHFYYLRNISILVILLSLVTLTAFQELIIRTIYSHVRALSDDIKDVRRGEKMNVGIPYLLELKPVADGFNDTVNAMRSSQEREKNVAHELYGSLIARQMATINAYKFQIQPHFLFNIMETMRSMAHSYNNNDLERLISSTSSYLRYTLRENMSVTLEKELEFIKIYFDIMETRFPGRYHLMIKTTEESLICEILAAVLQPLIENCMTHAFNSRHNRLIIFIKTSIVYEDNTKFLLVKIVDNGNGISDETMKNLEIYMRRENVVDPQIHIGLNNVYHRMLLYFGDRFNLNVRTKYGYYTSVEMKIPQR